MFLSRERLGRLKRAAPRAEPAAIFKNVRREKPFCSSDDTFVCNQAIMSLTENLSELRRRILISLAMIALLEFSRLIIRYGMKR